MNHQRICLECNIQLEEKTKYFVCPICGYSEKKYEWYRELLKEDYWCQNALTEYPIIIREKYLSIKSNIEEGQIPAAWLMLRDLFEITLKLPFLLLLSKDMEMDNIPFDTIKKLTERPISLGSWEQIAKEYCNKTGPEDEISIILKDIIKVYEKRKITSWRNNNIGHGAFSIQELEITYKDDIRNLLIYIKDHYEKNIDNYRNIQLKIIDGKVYWINNNRKVNLYPFIHTMEDGIYFFDAYYSNTEKTGMLDYITADKRKKLMSKMKDLYLAAKTYAGISNMDYSAESNMFSSRYIETLEEIENSSKIYDLTFLKDELIESLNKSSKGIFILEMEGGMGKTTFVRSMDPFSSNKRNLQEDIEVRAFYINNTYAHTPNYFALGFLDALRKEKDNSTVMASDLDNINPNDKNVKQNIANLLKRFSQYYGRKLLFIIDGLDEIPVSSGITIFDMIPDKDMLDDGVYILLTTRPAGFTTKFIENKIKDIKTTKTIRVTTNTEDYQSILYNFVKSTFKIQKDNEINKIIAIADNRFLNLDLIKRIYGEISLDKLSNNGDIVNIYLNILKKYYTQMYFKELGKLLIILAIAPEPLTVKELSTLMGYDSINFKILYYLAELRGLWQKENSYKNNLLSLQRAEYKETIINRFPNILNELCTHLKEDIKDFDFEEMNYEKINLITILLYIVNKFGSNKNKEIQESSGFKRIEKWINEKLQNYIVEHKYEEYQIIQLLDIVEKLLEEDRNYHIRRLALLASKLKYIMDHERTEYYYSAKESSNIMKNIILNYDFDDYDESSMCIEACSYIKRVEAMIIEDDLELEINNRLSEKQNYLFSKYKDLAKSQRGVECKLIDYLTEAKIERRNKDYEMCIMVAKEGINFYNKNSHIYPETFRYYAQLLNYIASSYRHLCAQKYDEINNKKFTYLKKCGEYYSKLQEEIENFISINSGDDRLKSVIHQLKERLIYTKMEIAMYFNLKGDTKKALTLIEELLNINENRTNLGLVLDHIVRLKVINNRSLVYYNNSEYEKAWKDAIYVKEELIKNIKKTGLIDERLYEDNYKLLKNLEMVKCQKQKSFKR